MCIRDRVSTYKTRLQQKLGMTSVLELAEFAKRNALLGEGEGA